MWLPAPSASEAAVAKVAADAVKEPLPTDPLVLSKDDSSTITASTNAALDILESVRPVVTSGDVN